MVQWLKNLLCNAGDAGSIPGPGTKIPHAAGQLKPMRNNCTEPATPQSPWAAMKGPKCHS